MTKKMLSALVNAHKYPQLTHDCTNAKVSLLDNTYLSKILKDIGDSDDLDKVSASASYLYKKKNNVNWIPFY